MRRIFTTILFPIMAWLLVHWGSTGRQRLTFRSVHAFSFATTNRCCRYAALKKSLSANKMHQRHNNNPSPFIVVNRQWSGSSTSLGRSALWMTVEDDDSDDKVATSTTTTNLDVNRTWNIPGLKKEVARLILRSHKKIGKTSQKLNNAQAEVERLTSSDDVAMEELENCPNVDAIELELTDLQQRLQGLNKLEEDLQGIKKKEAILPEPIAILAIELGIDDKPPPRPQRGPSKPKGPRTATKSRLPYRRYFSVDNIEIRVGKKAEDNDQLTMSPDHRDGSDWWMHAAGCPGSHVVIRFGDENIPEEVVMDAAALAARQSKCQGSVIKVSMTKCQDIRKPAGAKAGLVQLVGNVRTISVNMKDAEARLARLEETVLVN